MNNITATLHISDAELNRLATLVADILYQPEQPEQPVEGTPPPAEPDETPPPIEPPATPDTDTPPAAPDGDTSTDPQGSYIPIDTNIDAALAELQGAHAVTIQLTRGKTYNITRPHVLYGSNIAIVANPATHGDRPILNMFSSQGARIIMGRGNNSLFGLTLSELDVRGDGMGTLFESDGMLTNLNVSDCVFTSMQKAFVIAGHKLRYYNIPGSYKNLHFENCIFQTANVESDRYCIYFEGTQLSLQGCGFSDGHHHVGGHLVRIPYADELLIENCDFRNPPPHRHALKLHAPHLPAGAPPEHRVATERVIIRNTRFYGGNNSDWTVTIGPQDNKTDMLVRDVLIEDCEFTAGEGTQVSLMLWCQDTAVRNCRFAGPSRAALMVDRRGIEPPPIGIVAYGNLFTENSGGAVSRVEGALVLT